jgi:hypothetical protein
MVAVQFTLVQAVLRHWKNILPHRGRPCPVPCDQPGKPETEVIEYIHSLSTFRAGHGVQGLWCGVHENPGNGSRSIEPYLGAYKRACDPITTRQYLLPPCTFDFLSQPHT